MFVVEPVTPDDAISVAGVVARLAIWARNAPKGLARVEYDSGHALERAVGELQAALSEHGVPFHEIALPGDRDPADLVRGLVARLRALPPGGLVSITGWATAFSRDVSLADALRLLNANRENLAQFELCQVWWLTRLFTDSLRHVAPDLDSWFMLKLALEASRRVLPTDHASFASQWSVSNDRVAAFVAELAERAAPGHEARGEASQRAAILEGRFMRALASQAETDDLRDLAWRALAVLYGAALAQEGEQAADRIRAAMRARGLPDVVPPPVDTAALERLSRGTGVTAARLDRRESWDRFVRLRARHAEAADLLRCTVFFGPEPIPEELLDFALFVLPRPGVPGMPSWSERQNLLRSLVESELMRHDPATRSYLVPEDVRTAVRDLEHGLFLAPAIQAVSFALSHFALAIPVLQQRLWPHVRACVALAKSAHLAPLRELAQALSRRAESLHEAQRHEDALRCHEAAVAVLRALAKRQPADFTLELAQALDAQSVAYRAVHRWHEAVASAQAAVEHCWRLDERTDGVRTCLARALDNLSFALGALSRHAEALAAAEEAVRHHRVLAQRKTGATRAALAASLANLAAALGVLGRPAEAEQAAQEARLLSSVLEPRL